LPHYGEITMRLTVGPLPAAVYWRRRVLVLSGIVLLILILALSCGGPGSPNVGSNLSTTMSPKVVTPASQATGASVTPSLPAATSPAFTLPGNGGNGGDNGSGGDSGGGSGGDPTDEPANPGSGPCTDTEMTVTALASVTANPRGKPMDLTLKIRNASARTCTRDIGAPMQELQVLQGTTVVWSSDDCKPDTGKSVRTFQAGQEAPFTLRWSGRVSRTGTGAVICEATAQAPPIGAYNLVGRLDKKYSEPYAFRLT